MFRMLALVAVTLVFLVATTTAGCRRSRAPVDEDSTTPPPTPSLLSKALQIEAEYGTAPLSNDLDDPAIWVHATDPSRSVIIGTMKVAAPAGAVVVFGMGGTSHEGRAGGICCQSLYR